MADPYIGPTNIQVQPRFIPSVDQQIVVDLPGERTRATVRAVHDSNTLVVELTSIIMGKAHFHRTGDVLPFKRARNEMGQEVWTVIDERDLASDADRIARTAAAQNQEKDDAAAIGNGSGDDQPEHQGDDGVRPPASTVRRRKSA